MNRYIYFVMIRLIFTLFIELAASSAFAQVDTVRTPTDTLYFAGYTAIYYRVEDVPEKNLWMNEWSVYLCDKKLLTTMMWSPGLGFYNYYYNPDGSGQPCYFRDINNDGKGEIIFQANSGGNDGRASTIVYSLDTAATKICELDGLNKGLGPAWLDDLDYDSIPELVTNDRHYECWPDGCAGSPAPYLVWKWDGNQYRLANFKLSNIILDKLLNLGPANFTKMINAIEQDTSKIRNFNPNDEYNYPVELISNMLNLCYDGRKAAVDSLLEFSWAKDDTTKSMFEKIYWKKVNSSYYWKDLQQSNW